MQMRDDVMDSHRRQSEIIVGSGRRFSAVGSYRSVKETNFSCYYTIVEGELICGNEAIQSHMWERRKVPSPVLERMRSKKRKEKHCRKGK